MKKYNTLRICFAGLYLFTSFINLFLGLTNAEIIRSLADYAYIGVYRYFAINAPTILLTLSLISFAVYQWILCFLLLNKGKLYTLGVLGALIFHIGIIPWGPFNLPNLLFLPVLIIMLTKNFETNAFKKKKLKAVSKYVDIYI